MLNPVRTLAFNSNGPLYAFAMDADLQRGKAQKLSLILEDEDIEPSLDNLPMDMIAFSAAGNIRPMAMRLIIEVLAE